MTLVHNNEALLNEPAIKIDVILGLGPVVAEATRFTSQWTTHFFDTVWLIFSVEKYRKCAFDRLGTQTGRTASALSGGTRMMSTHQTRMMSTHQTACDAQLFI